MLLVLGSQLLDHVLEIVEVLLAGLLVLGIATVDILDQFELEVVEVRTTHFRRHFLLDLSDLHHDRPGIDLVSLAHLLEHGIEFIPQLGQFFFTRGNPLVLYDLRLFEC